jgi:serine/threonine protein phosphatase PrpC
MTSKYCFVRIKLSECFRPSDGEYIEHHLEIGDLLLVASDGLFDNLYEDFIVQIINNHLVSLN